MFDGVIIDMENNNALIALAYIKENENPFIVFCNYITVCINLVPEKKLRHDELLEKIQSEFGLKMPHHMVNICIRILLKEKKINKLQNGAGYCLIDTSFDINEFNMKRLELKGKEERLIDEIIEYVKKFNINWSYDDAKSNLTRFLISQENAYNLFVNGSINSTEDKKHVLPEWYIGKYITSILNQRNLSSDYLLDIVNGLMVYIGVHQTQDYFQEKQQKFRGTDFYIDTRILMRAMGYSWELEVEAANELLDLITIDYKGNICVFEHTIGEIESALSNAASCLSQGKSIVDFELRTYANLNKCDAFSFDLFSKEVRKFIEEKLKFKIQPHVDWQDERTRNYNLDWKSLSEFIQKKHPSWKTRAITNDVNAINYINILRKGNYSVSFGGKDKLPIFVTSNSPLVWDVRSYVSQCTESPDSVSWNINTLPIVSDNMIMCRLWVPKAKTLVSIPTLTLARNAYSAQQGNVNLLEKIKQSAKELKAKHNIDIIDISEVRKTKIEEILVKNISGNTDEITTDVIANSVDEYIRIETLEIENSNINLKKENEENVLTIDRQKQQIILSSTERFKNKIGMWKLLIYAAQGWWVINTLIFGSLSIALSQVKSIQSIAKIQYFGYAYVGLFLLFKVLEKYFNKTNITEFLVEKAVTKVWSTYVYNIKKSLIGMEQSFEKEIFYSCLENTEIFSKYQKYCKV